MNFNLYSFIRKGFLLWFSLGLVGMGYAQIKLTGKVIDAKDKTPIIGATVVVKGSKRGAVTNADGVFSLNVKPNEVLITSYVGYISQTIPLKNESEIIIQMEQNSRVLDELVVTALGITKQSKSLGYAVQTIDSKQLTNAEDANLVNNLSAKVAGVQIVNGSAGVGSTSRIVIRGENSFSTSNQPLFVVDGIPINNETFFNNAVNNSSERGTWAEVDWGNGAAEINPSDIEKITVLKGATAAALYGSRAANGAIVLTTKKGSVQQGLYGVSINTSMMFDTPLRYPRIQNQYGAGNGSRDYQYVDGGQSYENNIPNYGKKFDPNLLVPQFDSPAGQYQAADLEARKTQPGVPVTPTPWVGHSDNFRKFLQVGVTSSNNISFSSGSDKGTYRFSYGNILNQGIAPNTNLVRHSFTVRGEQKLTDKLTSNVFIDYINSSSKNRPNIGYGSENVMYTFYGVYGMPTNINLESLRNKWWQTGQEGVKQFRYWNNHDNPYVTLFENTNSFVKNRIISNASLKYDFTNHLNFLLRTGIDYYTDNREGHRAFSTVRFPNGGFRTDNVGYFENNTDFLLNYQNQFNKKFNVNFSVGGNRFLQKINYVRNIANDLISPGLYNFSNAQTLLPPYYFKSEKSIYSLYAFGQFDYKSLVFLDLTARNDWSSTLPAHKNSYFYPAASLSAIISDMVSLPKSVSYLKLRLSAAQVGRDAAPYAIKNTFVTNDPFGNYPLTSASNVLANGNLKPSITNSEEVGIELRLFKNRFGIDATVYNSNTKDEVVQLPIPVTSGYTNAFVNGGIINNKGIEVILNIAPIRSGNKSGLNWDMIFNFSRNISRVVSLPAGLSTYKYAEVTQYDRYFRSIQYNAVVGERLGNMYGRTFVRNADGQIVYKNGVPLVTGENDRRLLGNYNPDFTLGLYNTFQFRKFNVNMLWDWRQGGVFYSYTMLGLLNGGLSVETLPGRETGIIGKGVKEDGSGKYVPNDVKVSAANYYLGYYNPNNNEVFTYDASYVKLRELSIGYTLDHIFGKNSLAKLHLSLIGRNLLLFTKNKDVDPENLALRGDRILPGIEYNSYPSTKSMGFSVGLNF